MSDNKIIEFRKKNVIPDVEAEFKYYCECGCDIHQFFNKRDGYISQNITFSVRCYRCQKELASFPAIQDGKWMEIYD